MMRVQKIREKGEGEWATMEERERETDILAMVVRYV